MRELTTATRSVCFRSSSVNVRPIVGLTASAVKNPGVTAAARSRAGPSFPRFTPLTAYMPMLANDRAWSSSGAARGCIQLGARLGRAYADALKNAVETHEALGMRIGQRTEQHRIDDAEHGGIGANPEPKGNHRRRGKRGRPPNLPDGIPD